VRSSGFVKFGLFAVLAGAVVLFFLLGGHRYIDLETIKASRTALLEYRDGHFALALIVAAALFALSTALSLPIATLLSLLIGLLFGRYVGTLVIAISGTVGATILFVAARYIFADFLRPRVASSIGRLDGALRGHAFTYLAMLRIIPIVPFWLVNLVSAFTAIDTRTYAAATLAGMIPISFIWASLGESLEQIESLRDALSGTTLIALTALGVLGLLAIALRSFLLDRKVANAGD
jgi:uncharacterized membrane protein YdjX (TVP38/TMEM64 family)